MTFTISPVAIEAGLWILGFFAFVWGCWQLYKRKNRLETVQHHSITSGSPSVVSPVVTHKPRTKPKKISKAEKQEIERHQAMQRINLVLDGVQSGLENDLKSAYH